MTTTEDIEFGLARLLVAFQRFSAQARQAIGLSRNEEAVLQCLARGVTTPADVSREVGMTTAGMTNLLDRLERDGFVRREPHASDKRRILLTLTKRGYRAQLERDELRERVARSATEDATEAELDLLVRFLDRAVAEMERAVETGVSVPPAAVESR